MNYKKAYVPANGYTPICKIGECSLKKLEFGIIELEALKNLISIPKIRKPLLLCLKVTAMYM